jgi:hypothetical protein
VLTDEDATAYVSRRFPVGEKGSVKLWREQDALGIVVLSCKENLTSKLNIPTEWWTCLRGVVKVRNSELEEIKSMLHFLDSKSVTFELPGVMTRGRFVRWTQERIREHHDILVENLQNRNGVERAVFGFRYWGEVTNHDRAKKRASDTFEVYLQKNPNLPIFWQGGEDWCRLMYGWGGV